MGIFGWLKPEEEPEDGGLVEVSDGSGTHIVINTPNLDDALDVEGQLRRDAGAKSEPRLRGRGAAEDWEALDHDQLWVKSSRTVDPNEDREPEVDDDTIVEADEQSASKGWWPF